MNKFFLIYTNNKIENPEDVLSQTIILRDKFSFLAFLLTPVWLLYHKLWKYFFTYLVFVPGVTFLMMSFDNLFFKDYLVQFISYAFAIYIAIYSTSILHKKLQDKDYSLVSVIYANNKEEAMVKYMNYL
ncbi:MAG: hypothetical protein ACI8ZF_000221 [Candidatus Midichloriaceae bacterium]|jgi:hypothetical protein